MASSAVSVCEKCNKNINLSGKNFIICDGECKKAYHSNSSCSGISKHKLTEIVRDKSLWFCLSCKSSRDRRRSSIIPSQLQQQQQHNSSTGITSLNPTNTTESDNITNKQLSDKLDEILNFQKTLEKVDDYKALTNTIMEENTNMQNELYILKEQFNTYKQKVEKHKQTSLNYSLALSGIPIKTDENLKSIFIAISNKLNVDITQGCIKEIYRKPHSNDENNSPSQTNPPKILIEFFEKKTRDSIMNAYKKSNRDKKYLNTGSVFGDNTTQPVYIEEVLTKLNSYLFKKARDLKRQNKIAFAWVTNGRVLVRLTEKGKVREIRNIDFFNEL